MNKAGIASSNKTGLVLKITAVLFLLLSLLLYKLNDYFKNDKTSAMQSQVRKRVISVKTSVSSQLSQLRNVLSGYETELSDANINWLQLDPFFAIARIENQRVTHLVVRSGTPAERWNASYFEKALAVNRAKTKDDVRAQLFKDRANTKYLILRFNVGSAQELAVAGTADYFQKYFDIERGSRNKSLLVTSENILAAHTEADYIANSTKEARLPKQKYIIEKEEIVGTNLMAVSYVLKSKVVAGFAVPWSIVGVVLGFGFVLIGILFYNLDPIERRVERYRKQEREQIYKNTFEDSKQSLAISGRAKAKLEGTVSTSSQLPLDKTTEQIASTDSIEITKTSPLAKIHVDETALTSDPGSIVLNEEDIDQSQLEAFAVPEEEKQKSKESEFFDLLEPLSKRPIISSTTHDEPLAKEVVLSIEEKIKPVYPQAESDQFLTLDEEKIDLEEIEKALALDDFDSDQSIGNIQAQALEKNLQTQKVSLSSTSSLIEKPQFKLEKKDFKVDEIKVNIRRPERS